jgi:phage/plasmid-associated DNA primase
MISKQLYKSEILSELSLYIFKTIGFNLKFTNKKMDEHYLDILDLHQLIDVNIWDLLEDMNHSDLAKLYCKLSPSKYIYSNNTGWYEYNNYNILISHFKNIPPSLLSNVTNTLQKFIINERNKVIPPQKTDEDYDKKINEYDRCMKLAKKGYINVGNSSYVKSIIEYLSNLYNVDGLDQLIDSNINLLAFEDQLYDFNLLKFRNIDPKDYISKTTKYYVPNKNEEYRQFIMDLLYSIFENNEMVEYWLITTALSLFSNRYESLYIHSGRGGNGKSLLSNMITKALGDYFYSADNTFLTSIFKSGQANPTLAKCKGIRYLLVSEPDNGSDDVKFNIDFIKMLTGGDIITTRDLYKTNVSYKPQFTPFVQCNKKPNLGKLDNGVK